MTTPNLSEEELNQIKDNAKIRRALARESHYWFFTIYLGDYIQYPFAPFHHQMFEITEDQNNLLEVLAAFRTSGKSTIATTSSPIWTIIGKLSKKFVLIVSQTQPQARLHLANIKRELEGNDLLKADIGPFQEESDEWGVNSIVLQNFGARISIASVGQSVRGIRHGQHRPDLIILDDVEDLDSTKTQEGREKTFNWFSGEIIPAGDKTTKIIVVGNLVHSDSLIMRLKNLIDDERLVGRYFAFPLLDQNNKIAWPGKYPSLEDIEKLKKSVPLEAAFFREYLLTIISDEGRIVLPEWIHYYDSLPTFDDSDLRYTAIGVDLAISEKENANFTAMVAARVYGYKEKMQIFILPNPINERLDFPKARDKAKALSTTLGMSKLFVESTAYQKSFAEALKEEGYPAEPVELNGQDKRARLMLTTHLIQSGKILFPRKGAEDLIIQLVGFGVEKYDDLADAFSILIIHIMELETKFTNIWYVNLETGAGNLPSSPKPSSDPEPEDPVERRKQEDLEADLATIAEQHKRRMNERW